MILKLAKRQRAVLSLSCIVAVVLVLSLISHIAWNLTTPSRPRSLMVGDSWTYKVIYPDGESFVLTETVKDFQELNGTKAYVIMRDDVQHIFTEYLWITPDWQEIKTFQPNIGNLNANSTVTYSPPIRLFQIPFNVGDSWLVNSSITTVTELGKSITQTISRLAEERNVNGFEEVSTPAGTFSAFKITVSINRSVSEVLWFDTSLGQVVNAEYYNDLETVTQTIVSYSEAAPATSTFLALNDEPVPWMKTSRKLYVQHETPFLSSENSL